MRRAVILVGCLGIVACHSGTGPPAPSQVVFKMQPGNAIAAQVMTPAVQVAIEDASGNVVTSSTMSVTLALGSNPTGAVLLGSVTANAVKGVATFPNVFLDKSAPNYTLHAITGSLPAATSSAFAVLPGPAAQLSFTAQPAEVPAGRVVTPAVQVTAFDLEGNVATGFAGAVTVALGANPGGALLSGVLTSPAAAGVASFPNLVISYPGSGYTLLASAGTFGTASLPFVVDSIGSTGIDYYGGPVIDTPRVAALYWSASVIYNGGPTPGTFGAPTTADQSIVASFLNSLGGSSFFNITATYADASGNPIRNDLTYTQYWADARGRANTAPTTTDITAEIESGFASGALTYDPNTIYAVFTGTGVNLGGGFGTNYCAYHSFFIDSIGRNVKYAAMPYAYDYIIAPHTLGCSLVNYDGSPNSDPPADAEVNLLAHELAETITDANLDAWIVVRADTGYEMADLCGWNFGSVYATATGNANQLLGGKNYLVQMLWVNAENAANAPAGCQQSWTTGALALGHSRRATRGAFPSPPLNVSAPRVMRMFSGAPRQSASGQLGPGTMARPRRGS